MSSLQDDPAVVEFLAGLSRFRLDFRSCLTARGDELFELADGVLCAGGPVRTWRGCRWRQSTAVGTASCMTRGDVVYVRPARVQASRHVLAVVVAGDPHSGPISLPDEWQAHVPETDDNKIMHANQPPPVLPACCLLDLGE